MEAREFHAFAGTLAARSSPSNKAAIRSAISRAYYALYLCVVELMVEAGVIDSRDTAQFHGKAVLYLTNCDDQTFSSLGTSLGANRLLRNGADYEMGRLDVETLGTAKIMIEDVSTQLNKINIIRNDPLAVKRLADQITAYRLKTGDRR